MEKQTPIFIVCMGNPWGWNETILKIFYDKDVAEQWIDDQRFSLVVCPFVYVKSDCVITIVPDEESPPVDLEKPPEEPVKANKTSWLDDPDNT